VVVEYFGNIMGYRCDVNVSKRVLRYQLVFTCQHLQSSRLLPVECNLGQSFYVNVLHG
jgi:hypothetical protein